MKMFYYRGEQPNFGDELNHWLWPKLLPDFFDEDISTLFVGIGSTIGDVARYPGKKLVFGAGFVPQYHPKPIINEDWKIYFVRGPRTAARLALDPSLAITDAGALIRTVMKAPAQAGTQVSFMPHWQSLPGQWSAVCEQAGITLIDPRAPVDTVLQQIGDSKLVIAEAMHGAIIADALRVPWLPVLPLNPAHREKWLDWAESLAITLSPARILPSAWEEVRIRTGGTINYCTSRAPGTSFTSRAKAWVGDSRAAPWINRRLVELSARRLSKLASYDGQLSDEYALNRATERMLEKLVVLKGDVIPAQ